MTLVGEGGLSGKVVLIKRPIKSITHSPVDVRIVCKEPLRVKATKE